MGKAEQRTKDAAMAASLLRGDGDPAKVAARKRNQFNAAMARLRPGIMGSAAQRRRRARA